MSNEELLKRLAERDREIDELKLKNAELEEKVKLLNILHFGSSSEKLTAYDEKQGSLFNEAEDNVFDQCDPDKIEAVAENVEVNSYIKKSNKKSGRKPISENLPREVVEFDIPEEDKTCACGTEKICIGEDVSERVKIKPAEITVLQEIRKKYACKCCEGTTADEKGVQTAEGVRHIIKGSIADESLIAWSIGEKFEFALPFYRQSKRLAQIGIPIPRATLSNLVIKSAEACRPLYDKLVENIKTGGLINADETRIQVLNEPGRKASDKSWMWVFQRNSRKNKSVVFQYETGRSHQIPYSFLKDYTGWIQTDDYQAYHTAIKKIPHEIKHVLCWAHARRNFYKYWESTGKKDISSKEILELIKDLFNLEDLRSDFSLRGFNKQRKYKSISILEKLHKKLINLYKKVPPSMALGKAINYTLSNWEQLILYLENPELTPSNNSAENAIRPFVIGRKNWLFAGSPKGAKASAIIYSLVESAKMNNLPVIDYFNFILKKIPYCSSTEDYTKLMPFNLTPDDIKNI